MRQCCFAKERQNSNNLPFLGVLRFLHRPSVSDTKDAEDDAIQACIVDMVKIRNALADVHSTVRSAHDFVENALLNVPLLNRLLQELPDNVIPTSVHDIARTNKMAIGAFFQSSITRTFEPLSVSGTFKTVVRPYAKPEPFAIMEPNSTASLRILSNLLS